MEKGGTSVIADGYLVHGEMTEEEALFAFGFGVVRPVPTAAMRALAECACGSVCNWWMIFKIP